MSTSLSMYHSSFALELLGRLLVIGIQLPVMLSGTRSCNHVVTCPTTGSEREYAIDDDERHQA